MITRLFIILTTAGLTGCALNGVPGLALPGLLLLFAFAACRPVLSKRSLAEFALRSLFTGKHLDYGSRSCSATRDFSSNIDLSTYDLAANGDGFKITGSQAGGRTGFSVSGAGDVNNDGIGDLLVGSQTVNGSGSSRGRAHVIYGRGSATDIDLASFSATDGVFFDGPNNLAYMGSAVSELGDMNGDNIDDFLISASYAHAPGTLRGNAWVVYGKSGGPTGIDFASDSITAADGFRMYGGANNDYLGDHASSAGDVNGDGMNDLIVGAYRSGGGTGNAYVVYGTTSQSGPLNMGSLATANGFTIAGSGNDRVGDTVSGGADFNGDGIDDLVVGARYADPPAATNAGSAFAVFGKSGGVGNIATGSMTVAEGIEIGGQAGGYFWGSGLSSAGDFNGDGLADFAVGGPANANGKVALIFGKSGGFSGDLNLVSLSSSDGILIDGAGANDTTGAALSLHGDLNADGQNDLIIGAPQADPGGRSNAGKVYVLFGRSTGLVDFTVSSSASSEGFVIEGSTAIDFTGRTLKVIEDVNGDYCDDLIIGAPNFAGGNGSAYVIFGGKTQ